VGGDEAEGGVGLQHLVLGRPDVADLPHVIHDAQPIEAGLVRRRHDPGEVVAEGRRSARPGEIRNVQS
jgi:hypothetical protein